MTQMAPGGPKYCGKNGVADELLTRASGSYPWRIWQARRKRILAGKLLNTCSGMHRPISDTSERARQTLARIRADMSGPSWPELPQKSSSSDHMRPSSRSICPASVGRCARGARTSVPKHSSAPCGGNLATVLVRVASKMRGTALPLKQAMCLSLPSEPCVDWKCSQGKLGRGAPHAHSSINGTAWGAARPRRRRDMIAPSFERNRGRWNVREALGPPSARPKWPEIGTDTEIESSRAQQLQAPTRSKRHASFGTFRAG